MCKPTEQPRRRRNGFDSGRVDIDLHLLGADPIAGVCLARDHHQIETVLDPGTYHLFDTFTDRDGNEQVVPCLYSPSATKTLRVRHGMKAVSEFKGSQEPP